MVSAVFLSLLAKGLYRGMYTNNDNIIAFHDQRGGQETTPEHGLFVFLHSLGERQLTVGSIAFLRSLDEGDCIRIVQFQIPELSPGRNNLLTLHSGGQG